MGVYLILIQIRLSFIAIVTSRIPLLNIISRRESLDLLITDLDIDGESHFFSVFTTFFLFFSFLLFYLFIHEEFWGWLHYSYKEYTSAQKWHQPSSSLSQWTRKASKSSERYAQHTVFPWSKENDFNDYTSMIKLTDRIQKASPTESNVLEKIVGNWISFRNIDVNHASGNNRF